MGDRCNIVVTEYSGNSKLYDILQTAVILYGHWSGEEAPERLRVALAKRWRWDDSAYLARIIFDEFTAGHHGEETGFGITIGGLPDNERPILVVSAEDREVWVFENFSDPPIGKISFDTYAALGFPGGLTWDKLIEAARLAGVQS